MKLLTDEEIERTLVNYTGSDLGYPHTSDEYVLGEHRAIAKAQAKLTAREVLDMVVNMPKVYPLLSEEPYLRITDSQFEQLRKQIEGGE